jgi:CBS domain-containing protein
MTERTPGTPVLLERVRALLRRPAVHCPPGSAAADVAALMVRERVGSVVVVDAQGAAIGIVTDRDLRTKLVARGGDARTTTAASLMSAPLVTVRPDAFVFEAMLEMTRREIRHLVVVDGDGRLAGVVSATDVLASQTTDPIVLARRIAGAPGAADLAALAGRATDLVRRLYEDGASAYDIGQIVAELNDRIVARVLELVTASLAAAGAAPPPARHCWLAMGSEARREQTLRTDQDNALVYADPAPGHEAEAQAYYGRLAHGAIAVLVEVGFPRCEGDFMASNPAWCRPLSAWRAGVRQWMAEAPGEQRLAASIVFDLRPVAGAVELGAALRELIVAEAPGHRPFLGALARDAVGIALPRTLLGRIAVERRGPRRGTVDVKSAGVLQLVGAARVDALALGLAETNTVDRIRGAGAYQHLLRLRLGHQLARIAAGMPPDNFVDPAALSHADRLLFREALTTTARVQGGLRQRFATDFSLA